MNCDHHDSKVVKVESTPFLRTMKCNICGEFFMHLANPPKEEKEVSSNFCKDCHHCRKPFFGFGGWECWGKANIWLDRVTGRVLLRNSIEATREDSCKGNWFLPSNKKLKRNWE